jgi:Universal stress protein family
VRRSDGSIDSFVAVIEDICARKRAEELLKHQADLLNQSHDAILELQTDGLGIVGPKGYTATRLSKPRDAEPTRCSRHELIIAAAQWHHIDLIVLGSGMGAVARLILGTVAMAVVRHAKVSAQS